VEAAPEEFTRTKLDGVPAVRSVAFAVPVRSLDCGIGLQNTHLFETLGATAHPNISFALSDYVVDTTQNPRTVRINGALRIAGVERNIVVRGVILRGIHNELILRGDREIDVRTFGIKPPRRFLGLLRVRDEVIVHFEVVVRPLIDPLGILAAGLQ
jgi:polyisoprenoid-binding protein YceI